MIEYFLSVDFLQESIRTILHQNLQLDKKIINKMFPFNNEDFVFKSEIIKKNEMIDLKFDFVNSADIEVKTSYNPDEDKTLVRSFTTKNSMSLDENENEENKSEEKLQKNSNGNTNDDFLHNSNLNSYSLNRGSNNFIISGKYTKTGKAILCNDPHLMNGIPTFWYMSNLKIGNEYNFVGANHPGMPTYLIGTNGHISWGITNGLVDTCDVLKFKRNKNEGEFILDGKVVKLKKRLEKIYLDIKKTKFEEVLIYDSEFGPVINGYVGSFFKTHYNKNLDFKDQNEYYYIAKGNYLEEKFSNGFSEFFLKKDLISFRKSLKDITISLNLVIIDVRYFLNIRI